MTITFENYYLFFLHTYNAIYCIIVIEVILYIQYYISNSFIAI